MQRIAMVMVALGLFIPTRSPHKNRPVLAALWALSLILSTNSLRAYLKASITNGLRTSWKLANGGLLGTRHADFIRASGHMHRANRPDT